MARVARFEGNGDVVVVDFEEEELPDIEPPTPSTSVASVTPTVSNRTVRVKDSREKLASRNRQTPYGRTNSQPTQKETPSSKQSKLEVSQLLTDLKTLRVRYDEKSHLCRTRYNNATLGKTFKEISNCLGTVASLHRDVEEQICALQQREEDQRKAELRREKERQELRAKEEAKSELLLCKICYANEKNCVIVPCGHSFCLECAFRLNNRCGFCREDFIDIVPFHLSD